MNYPVSVFIKTYGCQMNQLDTELVSGILAEKGMLLTTEESEADVILLNTCVVRDQAERKARGKLGLLSKLKRKRPELVLGVLGCWAQSGGQALLDKFSYLDIVCGTRKIDKIGDLVEQALSGNRVCCSDENLWSEKDIPRIRPDIFRAWVWIMCGCNNYCSYCIVPSVRGRETSRPLRAYC